MGTASVALLYRTVRAFRLGVVLTVPASLVVTLTARQQALVLAPWRAARSGHLLTLHLLLLLPHGYSPPQRAACLFCSRSRLHRSVAAGRRGTLVLTVPR